MFRSLEVESFDRRTHAEMMNTKREYAFEKLRVWQAARGLAKAVYLATTMFPRTEIYGLTSQCNRAAVSIAANLAEGSSRRSKRDQAHHR